jgi:hypothetical protein
MALDRLHLRRLRKNEPQMASAEDRRHFRRANYDWSFASLRNLRSKRFLPVPRSDKRMRDALRMLWEFEKECERKDRERTMT